MENEKIHKHIYDQVFTSQISFGLGMGTIFLSIFLVFSIIIYFLFRFVLPQENINIIIAILGITLLIYYCGMTYLWLTKHYRRRYAASGLSLFILFSLIWFLTFYIDPKTYNIYGFILIIICFINFLFLLSTSFITTLTFIPISIFYIWGLMSLKYLNLTKIPK